MDKDKKNSLFVRKGVNKCKNQPLKIRLQALINAKGMSESNFYNKLEISRQYWYVISWGLWECPLELKIKIAQQLGTDSRAIWKDEKG